MPLNRTHKLVWIGTFATAAIVAITLAVTLPPMTSRSNDIDIGAAGPAVPHPVLPGSTGDDDNYSPDQDSPDQASPDKAWGQASPDKASPDQAFPDQASPDQVYHDLPPEISCPCFAASSLDSVITSVRDGSVTLNNGSCVETQYGKKISYAFGAHGYSEYHSWGVGTFGLDWTCQHADTIRPGLSDEEYNACKIIVDDACTELEM